MSILLIPSEGALISVSVRVPKPPLLSAVGAFCASYTTVLSERSVPSCSASFPHTPSGMPGTSVVEISASS